MSAKSSGGQFSYAKALLFFAALLVCSSASVAAAESSSDIRNAHDLDKLSAASSSVSSIKHHLRSSADTKNDGYVISRNLGISQLTSLSEVISKVQGWWSRLWQKSSNRKYKDLELHKTEGGPFKSPKISDWVAYVESLHRNSLDDASKAMYSTLARRYKDPADLAKILVEGKTIKSTKDIASKLLDIQVQRWIKDSQSTKKVFRLLKLDKTEGGPIGSPVFLQWVAFATLKYEKFPGDAIHVMLLTLANQYKSEAALARALVAGEMNESTKSIASELLDAQAWRWIEQEKFGAHVFLLLELDKTKDKLFADPLFVQWAAFVNLKFEPSYAIKEMLMTLKVYYPNDVEFAKVLAAGTEIPATEEIALKLQEILHRTTTNKTNFPGFASNTL